MTENQSSGQLHRDDQMWIGAADNAPSDYLLHISDDGKLTLGRDAIVSHTGDVVTISSPHTPVIARFDATSTLSGRPLQPLILAADKGMSE